MEIGEAMLRCPCGKVDRFIVVLSQVEEHRITAFECAQCGKRCRVGPEDPSEIERIARITGRYYEA